MLAFLATTWLLTLQLGSPHYAVRALAHEHLGRLDYRALPALAIARLSADQERQLRAESLWTAGYERMAARLEAMPATARSYEGEGDGGPG